MSTITGRLVINTINGKFGEFNVGTLYSALGDFVVKYDGLDEFSEGTYEGQFLVCRAYQKTRKFHVGIIIEPVVEIDEIWLDDAYEGGQEDIPSPIPDPAEEEMQESGQDPAESTLPSDSDNSSDEDPQALFGVLWPLGETVKLDPTVGRAIFRQQRDYLKANGYGFSSMDQAWSKRQE